MPLFARNKDRAVEGFVISLLNTNCHALQDKYEGPRLEGRANLTVVVMVVPVEHEKPVIRKAFTAVTKEFSSKGVAVVLDSPCGLDEAFLGFRIRGQVTWLRARAKHLNPMGGGFFQLGFRMVEKFCPDDHPGLEDLAF
jgi:hypothetical protein